MVVEKTQFSSQQWDARTRVGILVVEVRGRSGGKGRIK